MYPSLANSDVIENLQPDSRANTVRSDWSLLVGDSHVKTIQFKRIEKALKGERLRNPAFNKPKEGSAFTTSRSWPGAHFPDSNLAERVPALLAERPYGSMIVLTPSNNIKNVEKLDKKRQSQLAVQTALDTVTIVEKALAGSSSLEKAVIVELPPRADSWRLSELTDFSNFALRGAVDKSVFRSRITIASLDSLNKHNERDIFGSQNYHKYDGVHMRGKQGARLYTDCILTAVSSAGLTSAVSSTPVSTSNRFVTLSN